MIIDDTPEAITLSSHDPVRREVARIALERLIQDGRIHPARIEEMVEKAKREVDNKIKQDGERAVAEAVSTTSIRSWSGCWAGCAIAPVMGRMCLSTFAGGLPPGGYDGRRTRCRCQGLPGGPGLLHDIGKALTHEIEGKPCADRRRCGPKVQGEPGGHPCHRGSPQRLWSPVPSLPHWSRRRTPSRRPGPAPRRENVESYIKRLEKLEEIAKSFDGVESCYAIQAGREIRIMIKPEVISDDRMPVVAREIVQKIESEMEYPRPDQGQPDPGDPVGGLRQVNSFSGLTQMRGRPLGVFFFGKRRKEPKPT